MIIDKLPEAIVINNVNYKVNTDFRKWIEFEMLLSKKTFSDGETVENISTALATIFIDNPINAADIQAIIDGAFWFYRCGKDKPKKTNAKDIYSFEHDDIYVYAAFKDQYGIDLQDVECLHWWKFKSLFQGLKSDNKIVEIMGYRAMPLDGKMSPEMRKFYKEMKETYVIPISKQEKQMQDAITQALLNGGDLTGIVTPHADSSCRP